MSETIVISTELMNRIRKLYFRIVPEPVLRQHPYVSYDEMISLVFEHLQYQENARIAYLDALQAEVESYLDNPCHHDACMTSGLLNLAQKMLVVRIKKDLFGDRNAVSKSESQIPSNK